MNAIQVEGALTENPKLERRDGKLKLAFRLAIPRSDLLPAKHGNNADFVTVIRYADSLLGRLLLTLDHAYLQKGARVCVMGWLQSRDVSRGRTATEIVAQSITYLGGTNRKGDEILALLNLPEPA